MLAAEQQGEQAGGSSAAVADDLTWRPGRRRICGLLFTKQAAGVWSLEVAPELEHDHLLLRRWERAEPDKQRATFSNIEHRRLPLSFSVHSLGPDEQVQVVLRPGPDCSSLLRMARGKNRSGGCPRCCSLHTAVSVPRRPSRQAPLVVFHAAPAAAHSARPQHPLCNATPYAGTKSPTGGEWSKPVTVLDSLKSSSTNFFSRSFSRCKFASTKEAPGLPASSSTTTNNPFQTQTRQNDDSTQSPPTVANRPYSAFLLTREYFCCADEAGQIPFSDDHK